LIPVSTVLTGLSILINLRRDDLSTLATKLCDPLFSTICSIKKENNMFRGNASILTFVCLIAAWIALPATVNLSNMTVEQSTAWAKKDKKEKKKSKKEKKEKKEKKAKGKSKDKGKKGKKK